MWAAAHVRDAAATAAIFGLFASSWFGWAQERPPTSWRRPLIFAAVVALVVAVVGGAETWSRWSDGSAFDSTTTSQQFGIVVGIEVALAGGGALVLVVRGHREFMSAWIALVVGIHFVPLAVLLDFKLLYLTAAGVTLVAAFALLMGSSRRLAVSAVTGVGTGVVLLTTALVSISAVVR